MRTRKFRFVLCFLALGVLPLRAETVRLAGTFNNWAAGDDAYRLERVGERYELVRFWPCGMYEFKFVFDGSWAKHLGSAGEDRLTQPGDNVALAIRKSGQYLIWFDQANRRWGILERKADRLHAIIWPRNLMTCFEVLNGGRSVERPGHPIKDFKWKVLPDAHVNMSSFSFGSMCFQFQRPGQYVIELTVNDGEMQDTDRITFTLKDVCWLEGGFRSKFGSQNYMGMLPWSEDKYAYPIKFPHLIPESVHFIPKNVDGPLETVHIDRLPSTDHEYLLVFDPRTKKVDFSNSGYHKFVCNPQIETGAPQRLKPERVELVGDFNGWKPGATGMHLNDLSCEYEAVLPLPDGVYHYKILVNGCIWMEDPAADPRFRQPDGAGGFNSGFIVGDDAAQLGAAKPNDINEKGLKHDPDRSESMTPLTSNVAQVTLRTLGDDVEEVDVRTTGGNELVPMHRVDSRCGFDYWSAQLDGENANFTYTFRLRDGSQTRLFGANGAAKDDGNNVAPFTARLKMSFQTPDWAKRAVWYQIFPERFRNGDPTNDPPRTVPWTQEWYKPFKGSRDRGAKGSRGKDGFEEAGDFWKFIFDRRYGGDLQGVRDKLGYLRGLGINAIYLNPVFLAESMHKYDASDFRHIDDFFGVKDSLKKIKGETTDPKTWQWSDSDRVFLDFLKEAHAQGFKVVIDGVFNHVGRGFWAFQDVLKRGEKSPYADWFDITSWKPFHYKAWDKDDGALPRLKHDDALGLAEPVREHLFAVTRRWMDPNGDGDPSDGIDGWRLDVAGDINANFWRDWRKLVKSINPDAYIVAELWEESRPWLNGQTFDAVMNYPFAVRCQRFFVNRKKAIAPSEFEKQLRDMLGWYAPQVNYVLQNLIGSHDTDRAASMFMNPDLEYDKANRQQDSGPKYNVKPPTKACYEKLKLMAAFQMTFLGAPMIYYGDEVGMYGADDPSCRKPMLWEDLMPYDDPHEKFHRDVYEYFRRMIAIRNTYPALQLGGFEVIQTRDDHGVFAFRRSLGSEQVIIVLNNSDQAHRLDVPVKWPADARIVRVDDPDAAKLIELANASARATVRVNPKHESSLKIERGRLHGCVIEPHSAAIFVRHDKTGASSDD